MRKDEKLMRAAARDFGVDPKSDMWRLPPKFVGPYAEQDALMTLKLWERLSIEISRGELHDVFDLESRLIPLMLDMRERGVRVDLDKAEQAKKMLKARVSELKKFIKDKTSVNIEPWANASVEHVFKSLDLTYPTTEKGAPSFTKQFLQAHPHEVAQAIVKLREADKADSTFIDSILRYEHKGRIHCEFHQLRSDDGGTVTGRFRRRIQIYSRYLPVIPKSKSSSVACSYPKRGRGGVALTIRLKSQGYWCIIVRCYVRETDIP